MVLLAEKVSNKYVFKCCKITLWPANKCAVTSQLSFNAQNSLEKIQNGCCPTTIIIRTLRSSPVLQPMRTSPAGVQQWMDGRARSQVSAYSSNCSASLPWSPATADTGSSRLALVVTVLADPAASFTAFASHDWPTFGGILYFLLHDNIHTT